MPKRDVTKPSPKPWSYLRYMQGTFRIGDACGDTVATIPKSLDAERIALAITTLAGGERPEFLPPAPWSVAEVDGGCEVRSADGTVLATTRPFRHYSECDARLNADEIARLGNEAGKEGGS